VVDPLGFDMRLIRHESPALMEDTWTTVPSFAKERTTRRLDVKRSGRGFAATRRE